MCGADEAETILSFDAPDVYETAIGVSAAGYDRRWVRCARCGFHFSRYSREAEAMARLYSSLYREGGAAWRGGSAEEIFDRVIALPPEKSETLARIAWIEKECAALWSGDFLPRRGTVRRALDVGGASGVFAWGLTQSGWQCAIVDPGGDGRFVEKRFGITYHERMFGSGAVPGQFDLITLNYTLEHCDHPDALVTAATDNLTEGGLLFIEVPDAFGFRYKKGDDDIFNSTHLWMFDPASLVRLMERCGFTPYALRRHHTVRGHFALAALFGVR